MGLKSNVLDLLDLNVKLQIKFIFLAKPRSCDLPMKLRLGKRLKRGELRISAECPSTSITVEFRGGNAEGVRSH